MEDYVTYEQSVKLKKLGFDWKTHAFYNKEGSLYSNNNPDYWNNEIWNEFSAPTLVGAQKWLREVKKIYVFSHIIGNPPRDKCKYYYHIQTNDGITVDSSIFTELYSTYEEALSKGIDKTLESIDEIEN